MFVGCRLKRGPKAPPPARRARLILPRASLPGVGMCRALPADFVFRRSSVSVSIVTRTALHKPVELS